MELIRSKYLDLLNKKTNTNVAKALIGIRRCGKSTILLQFIKQHFKSINNPNILYIDLEDYAFNKYLDVDYCYKEITKKINSSKNKKVSIFIDEIDRITDSKNTPNIWKYIITSFYNKTNLYVTSSNSKLLDKNTELTDRIDKIFVFPFSFIEFCEFHKNLLLSKYELFDKFLKEGGFPRIISEYDERDIRQQIVQLDAELQVRDIQPEIWNKGVKVSDSTLSTIKKYLFQQIGSNTSINKTRNNLKQNNIKIWNEDLSIIVDMITRSYQLYKADRYDIYGNQVLKTDWKLYVNDHSFRNIYVTNYKEQMGFLLENIVYFELLRRGYQVYIGKNNNKEIDFVAKKSETDISYIQVTTNIFTHNDNREYQNLEILDRAKKILLTLDREEKVTNKGIYKINLINWLLDENYLAKFS